MDPKVSFYKNASEIRLFLKSDKTEAKLNFGIKIESETLLGIFKHCAPVNTKKSNL